MGKQIEVSDDRLNVIATSKNHEHRQHIYENFWEAFDKWGVGYVAGGYPDFEEGHTGWSIYWTCRHPERDPMMSNWTEPQLSEPTDDQIPDECPICGNEDIDPEVQLVTKSGLYSKHTLWS